MLRPMRKAGNENYALHARLPGNSMGTEASDMPLDPDEQVSEKRGD